MEKTKVETCIAFEGHQRIAAGNLRDVVQKVKQAMDQRPDVSVLIFDDATCEIIEVDFRGNMEDVLKNIDKIYETDTSTPSPPEPSQKRGPGRPKIGVVGREVTLLPRHWEWLNNQPGGASVALRKLVEEARRTYRDRDKMRKSQETTDRFMSALVGNLPGYEEASRALFANNFQRFNDLITSWPADIRDYLLKLSKAAFQVTAE
jgi:hypothetical protein